MHKKNKEKNQGQNYKGKKKETHFATPKQSGVGQENWSSKGSLSCPKHCYIQIEEKLSKLFQHLMEFIGAIKKKCMTQTKSIMSQTQQQAKNRK